MKAYKSILILFLVIFYSSSCNDEFLELYPIEEQTEKTAFITDENYATFAWSLYSEFTNTKDYVQGLNDKNSARWDGDWRAGYLSSSRSVHDNNPYRTQTIISPSTGGGWSFGIIRKINMMLSHIDDSQMTVEQKEHWRSVGYFFHSYKYFELISRFGDVPWVDMVINEKDTTIIYGGREPRKKVADKVLERLLYAEKHIKENGNGDNTINKATVQALLSRFCLFEGTWRKYHQLGDDEKYLKEAIRVSEELMKKYPDVDPDYNALMCSEDLSTYKGIILYKKYIEDILGHNMCGEARGKSAYEFHKATVELYLCSDGKPISTSPLYNGDKTMYDEFRNRDNRLLMHVIPPYYMEYGLDANGKPSNKRNSIYYHADVNVDEYKDKLKTLFPNSKDKRLPTSNWAGVMAWTSPNIMGIGQNFQASYSGYYVFRHYDTWEKGSNLYHPNSSDKPIFYIDEVLLNYAEAMFEMGHFTQEVADRSINKLRKRAGVANMVVSEINDAFDPKRDKTVDPILWEIRRERIIELMGEGFGFQDIRRWKKGEWYINVDQMGVYIKKSDYTDEKGNILPSVKNKKLVDRNNNPVENEGYLKRFQNPVKDGKGWKDQYYLFPIPLEEIVLNPTLRQNPGWN